MSLVDGESIRKIAVRRWIWPVVLIVAGLLGGQLGTAAEVSMTSSIGAGRVERVSRTMIGDGIIEENVVLHPPGIGGSIPARLRYRADGRLKPVFIYIHGSGPIDQRYTDWHDALAGQGVFGVSIQATTEEAARLRSFLWPTGAAQPKVPVEGRRWFAFEVIRATALTVTRVIDVLPLVAEADVTRIAVGGASRGGSVANVVGWSDPRVGVVVSLIGGFDIRELLAEAPNLQDSDNPDTEVVAPVLALIDSIDPSKAGRPAIALHKKLILISAEADMTPRGQIERFIASARAGGAPVDENLRWLEQPEVGHATTAEARAQAARWLRQAFELPEG